MKRKETLNWLKMKERYSKRYGLVNWGKYKYYYLRKVGSRSKLWKKKIKERFST